MPPWLLQVLVPSFGGCWAWAMLVGGAVPLLSLLQVSVRAGERDGALCLACSHCWACAAASVIGLCLLWHRYNELGTSCVQGSSPRCCTQVGMPVGWEDGSSAADLSE